MIVHLKASAERTSVIPSETTTRPPTIRVVHPQVATVFLKPKRLVKLMVLIIIARQMCSTPIATASTIWTGNPAIFASGNHPSMQSPFSQAGAQEASKMLIPKNVPRKIPTTKVIPPRKAMSLCILPRLESFIFSLSTSAISIRSIP